MQELWENYRKCNENNRREKGKEEIFEKIMTEFPQIYVGYQSTELGTQETKLDKNTLSCIIFKLQKIKDKGKISPKKQKNKITFPIK